MRESYEFIIPLILISIHIYLDVIRELYYKIYIKMAIIIFLSILCYILNIGEASAMVISFIGFIVYVIISWITEIYQDLKTAQ